MDEEEEVAIVTKKRRNTRCGSNAVVATSSDKRSGRKGRKINEKELLKEYAQELTKGLIKSRANTVHLASSQVENLLQESSAQSIKDALPKPKGRNQEEYVAALRNPERKIVFATGPAGTGKTMLACSYALYQFLTAGTFNKLVFTRPMIAVDEEMGFLPGTLEEKMAPWVRPMWDVLSLALSQREIQALMDEKFIEIVPLGFMRGRTFINTWVIADEMQNATVNQMKMLTTRIGTGSRMVITGDLEQCDIDKTRHPGYFGNIQNGLADLLDRIQAQGCPPTIQTFSFDREDVQRETVVKDILKLYA